MSNFVEQLFDGRPDPKQPALCFKRTSLSKPKGAVKTLAIKYDECLILSLKREHEVLIENFGRILEKGFESKDFTLLCNQLEEFKVLLQNHMLKENVKLFCYLEQLMKRDSNSLASMRTFRKEINYWSNAVISFCKKYQKPVDVFFLQDSFKDEFQAVGKALIHRVQLVESEMYSLYTRG